MSLTQKHCVPCEGGVAPLQGEALQNYLSQVTGWRAVDDKKITRSFVRKNFQDALDFINAIGEIAEREGHHPDLFLHDYKSVTITLWTHAIGGLSENDFIVAAKIDEMA